MYKIAYALIGIGATAMIIWAAREFLTDPSVDLLIRIAVGAVGVGLLLLLIVVIRDRIRAARSDRFKGVQR